MNSSIALDSARLTSRALLEQPGNAGDLAVAIDMKRAEAAFEFEAASRLLRGATEAILPDEGRRQHRHATAHYAAGLGWLNVIFVDRAAFGTNGPAFVRERYRVTSFAQRKTVSWRNRRLLVPHPVS